MLYVDIVPHDHSARCTTVHSDLRATQTTDDSRKPYFTVNMQLSDQTVCLDKNGNVCHITFMYMYIVA